MAAEAARAPHSGRVPRIYGLNHIEDGRFYEISSLRNSDTAIAAIREKRNFIGFELNKEYYDKACKRIKLEQAQLTLF